MDEKTSTATSISTTTSIVILIAALILGGGLYFLLKQNKDNKNDAEVCAQVLTDARNPETGDIETFETPCDVPDGWDVLETDAESFSRGNERWTRYRNDDLGIRFEYRTEPSGYILVEHDDNLSFHEDMLENISLFDKKEYAELLASSVPREGPPGISVLIYRNSSNYSVNEWVQEESLLSNIGLSLTSPSEFEFSGVPAVRYTVDGLHTSDTIVALNNGLIYYISGSYSVENSQIRKDFLEMLDHISLY